MNGFLLTTLDRDRLLGSLAVGIIVTLLGVPAAAQEPPTTAGESAASPWTPPRTPWGDPDLQGSWPTASLVGTPFERPTQFGDRRFLTDEELAAREKQFSDDEARVSRTTEPGADVDDGTGPPAHWGEGGLRKASRQSSLIVDPLNGRLPPFTPWGQLRAANNGTTGPNVAMEHSSWRNSFSSGPWNGAQDFGPYDRCVSRGLLASMFPSGYSNGNQIVQAPGFVAIRHEMIHETRIIPLDGRAHVSPAIRGYMGDSRGRWEGNTLVVETTNFNGRFGARRNGSDLPLSDALHVVERFTRTDPETLLYEVTVDDPKTWTRPWTVAYPLKQDFEYGLLEYACHEGNHYAMTNMLSGARAAERAADAK
jgi:hypothetical protein